LDGDEVLVLIAGIIGSLVAGARWYAALARVVARPIPFVTRAALAITPPLCLLILLPFLLHTAAHEVTDDAKYVLLFEALGGAWLGLTAILCSLLGIGPRDDAIERRNPAAAIAVIGAMLGGTLIYAGANIGEGATIWMTIGPATLASAAWFAMWGMTEGFVGLSDTIVIDRDVASAVRLAALLIACGAILGRSVAGDYHSADATLRDFLVQGWPAAVLFVVAGCAHDFLRPTPERPRPLIGLAGLVPGLTYLLVAAVVLMVLGPWEGQVKHR
jgi:hypothetical protein